MAEEKKLFGMPAEKGRWLLIVLGFIINICLGSVYAYSIFGKQLMSEWGISTGTSMGMFEVPDTVRCLPAVLRRHLPAQRATPGEAGAQEAGHHRRHHSRRGMDTGFLRCLGN